MLLCEVITEISRRTDIEHIAGTVGSGAQIALAEHLMLWLCEHTEVKIVVVAYTAKLQFYIVGVVSIL